MSPLDMKRVVEPSDARDGRSRREQIRGRGEAPSWTKRSCGKANTLS
jgi:hypothetical protein